MRREQEISGPATDNLPGGVIDWAEISLFIEDMLAPHHRGEKGWKIIKDSSVTAGLQQNSVTVLEILCDDLYGFFFKQHADRHEVWNGMEKYIRTKYGSLSEDALSRIIATYQIDDR